MLHTFVSRLLCAAYLLLNALPATAQDDGAPIQAPDRFSDWTGWGGNLYNNRWSRSSEINSTSLGQLKQNCKLDYPLGMSAAAVVWNNTAYYPTMNGSYYALNYGTCKYVWEFNVTQAVIDEAPLTGFVLDNALPMSRTSAQIDTKRNILYLGTQAHSLLIALDVRTGKFLGKIRTHDHPLAIITMSPTVYDGNIYVGMSSQESSATVDTTYPCCDFRGKIASYSFDMKTKKFTERWHLDTLPEGWAGAGVWGSQPSIDPVRGQVFFASGNTYTYPQEYVKCINATADCLPDNAYQETVFAIDMASGKMNWHKTVSPLDAWVMVCGFAGAATSASPLCPERPGPDADFGMAPTFIPASLGDGTTGNDSLVIGQKSGNLYSFNAVTGDIQWSVITSPDSGTVGGPGAMSWGIAADDKSVYFTAINFGARDWTLQPNGIQVNNSAFGSANLKTGALQWEVPCPESMLSYNPPAIASDLMFIGQSGSKAVENSDDKTQVPGAVLALSKSNGNILRSFPVESIQRGGVMVAGGFIMFGSGYHYQNPFKSGSFYVYGLPDAIERAKVAPTQTTEDPDSADGLESPSGTSAAQAAAATTTSAGAINMISNAVYPMAMLALYMVWFT